MPDPYEHYPSHRPMPLVRSPLLYQVEAQERVAIQVPIETITIERATYAIKAPEFPCATTVPPKMVAQAAEDLRQRMHREIDRIFGLPQKEDDFYTLYINEPEPPKFFDYLYGYSVALPPDKFVFIKSAHADS